MKRYILETFLIWKKIKAGLCDHLAVCVIPFPINFCMPQRIFMKLELSHWRTSSAGYQLRAAAARGNIRCFAAQSRYHVAARDRTNTAARRAKSRWFFSSGKGITVCCALSVETVL
jgi:hypothetical protein